MVSIAVVGAGIAGCAAAIALRKLPGKPNVVVYEGRPREAWLDSADPRVFELWPNGLRALDTLGVSRVPGKSLERYDFRSRYGELLSSLPTGSVARRQRQSTLVVGAPQLRGWIARTAVAAGAQLQFGQTVKAVEEDDAHVILTLSSRTKKKYSLVIGADGAKSQIRRLAEFPLRELRKYRLAVASGLSAAGGSVVANGVGFVAHGHDRRLGGWFYPHRRAGVSSAWILFAPKELFFADNGALDRTPSELRASCEQALEGFGINLRRFVSDASEIRLHALVDAPIAKHDWLSRRIALVGEAAHPVLPDLGQGCALGFEDVALLHEKLSCVDLGDFPALTSALEAWRDARHRRVFEIVEQSRVANLFSHIDGGYPDLRDLAIATTAQPFLTYGLERLVDSPS